jgi:hydrogenase expression/formation protein HypC
MQILEINGYDARCEAKSIERDISLFMLQHEPLEPGDWVVAHVGYAIQKLTPQEARSTWELHEQISGMNTNA